MWRVNSEKVFSLPPLSQIAAKRRRKGDVDERPHERHLDPLPGRPIEEAPLDLVRFERPLFLHAGDFDVTAERKPAHLPFYAIEQPRFDRAAKADGKDFDFHADARATQ